MGEVFLDALIDSLKILAIVIVVYFILGLIEPKISHRLEHVGKWSPLIGVCFGLLPQCGFSVIAADLYRKKHITAGTVIGVFIATSDEALPIFLSATDNPKKILMVLPLIAVKFLAGVLIGYAVDFFYRKSNKEVSAHKDDCTHQEIVHIGCCGHEIEDATEIAECNEKNIHYKGNLIEGTHTHNHSRYEKDDDCGEDKEFLDELHKHKTEETDKHGKIDKVWCKRYLLHPLVHSLKIFAYVFVINVIFGIIMYYAEDKVVELLTAGKYITPLLSVVVGLIPNCASSVILSELYIGNIISFGACIGGLCVNAGLGLLVLYKDVKNIKNNLIITIILILSGIAIGYICCAIFGFDPVKQL